jgi:TPP-dependent pyruvate/acetoin dehydrogenase alpha subunit
MSQGITKEIQLSIYESMLRQRLLDEKVVELYKKGLIQGIAHPGLGQEAVAGGVIANLSKEDLIVSNHRGHGHSLAKGVSERAMLSELFGKESGMCRGRGGSMHSSDMECGVVFSTAIVGGGIPLAVGVALALKMDKKPNCVVCFFGDGACNTGAFHEALNMAAVMKLPIVFICENNQYAISTPATKSTAGRIYVRGEGYGIPGQLVNGMKALDVYEAASIAIARAKRGEGPTLIECETYRYTGHGPYDIGLDYRTQEEIDRWKERDPITNLEQILISQNLATPLELQGIRDRVRQIVEEAVQFAQSSAYPPKEQLSDYVWA